MKSQIQAAKRARKGIEQIREHLLRPTPESLSACVAPLTEAIHCMEMLQTDLQGPASGHGGAARELSAEIVRLKTELSQASALLQSAAEFHEGYGRLLKSHQDAGVDYSRVGQALRPPEVRKLILHG